MRRCDAGRVTRRFEFADFAPAREKRQDNAGIQTARVIVADHREQARSHKDLRGPCRSEPAREKRAGNGGIQTARVIVDVDREQARSHKDLRGPCRSEPAREKRQDNAGIQTARASRGIPSARSAMILRCISLLPP